MGPRGAAPAEERSVLHDGSVRACAVATGKTALALRRFGVKGHVAHVGHRLAATWSSAMPGARPAIVCNRAGCGSPIWRRLARPRIRLARFRMPAKGVRSTMALPANSSGGWSELFFAATSRHPKRGWPLSKRQGHVLPLLVARSGLRESLGAYEQTPMPTQPLNTPSWAGLGRAAGDEQGNRNGGGAARRRRRRVLEWLARVL